MKPIQVCRPYFVLRRGLSMRNHTGLLSPYPLGDAGQTLIR